MAVKKTSWNFSRRFEDWESVRNISDLGIARHLHFINAIQDKIDGGLLKFPDKGKEMLIDKHPFAKTAQAGPVYIHDHYFDLSI